MMCECTTRSSIVPIRSSPILLNVCRICLTMGVCGSCDHSGGSCEQCLCDRSVALVYEALFAAIKDYTTDSRGDIGAV